MPRTYCTSSSIIDLSHIQYYTDLSHLSEKLKNSFVGARYWICNTTKLKELLCGVFWIKEKILQQLMPTSILSFFQCIAVTFWKISLPGVPFFVLSDSCFFSLADDSIHVICYKTSGLLANCRLMTTSPSGEDHWHNGMLSHSMELYLSWSQNAVHSSKTFLKGHRMA